MTNRNGFSYSTEDVLSAVKKALECGTATAWTRDDFDEELTNETLSHFAMGVIAQFQKTMLEYLITDKTAEVARGLAIEERERANVR